MCRMHVVLVGPEFEENLSLRYLNASSRVLRQGKGICYDQSTDYSL